MSPQIVTNCESVHEELKKLVKNTEEEKHFFVCDMADVLTKIILWKENLPRVRPFYAVKTNPDVLVMRIMQSMGMGFDCSNKVEIELVLSLGAKPTDIVYSCTQKPISHIRYAAENQIGLLSFDCEEELQKIKKHYPNARLLLRLATPNPNAVYELSTKFGCSFDSCAALLDTANRLEMNVVGVVFHVGALCDDPSAYSEALRSARLLFNKAADLGYHFDVLDIGGGFPGSKGSSKLYLEMCRVLSKELENHFPEDTVHIIGEPGNYMVNSAYTLCTTIIGRKKLSCGNLNDHYFINDGMFGCIKFDWLPFGGRLLFLKKHGIFVQESRRRSKIWGCTACGVDYVTDAIPMPEMDVGDYVVFENMGSYKLSMATVFNGYMRPPVFYVYSMAPSNDDYRDAVQGILPPDWQAFMKQIPHLKLCKLNGTGTLRDDNFSDITGSTFHEDDRCYVDN